jgi:hypothetical protein
MLRCTINRARTPTCNRVCLKCNNRKKVVNRHKISFHSVKTSLQLLIGWRVSSVINHQEARIRRNRSFAKFRPMKSS